MYKDRGLHITTHLIQTHQISLESQDLNKAKTLLSRLALGDSTLPGRVRQVIALGNPLGGGPSSWVVEVIILFKKDDVGVRES